MNRICIVTPNYQAYSETFIQNHIQHLPNEKVVVYALGQDAHFDSGSTLLKMNKVARLYRFAERQIRRVNILDQEISTLVKYLKRENIRCVLAEYGTTGAVLVEACKAKKIPLVVHFHGYDAYHHEFIQTYKNAYQKMFEYAKSLIAVSKDMRDQLYKLGAPEQKIKLIPYGIDLNHFSIGKSHTSTNFLLVGRLVEKKAPFLSILAFKKVIEKAPYFECKLTIVGTGPLEWMCKQLAKSIGVGDKVVFKGILSNDDVARLMRESFCFIQHSLTPESGDSEGTPLAILEASASGLPVISTKHGGIQDAVVHGETGFLVEEGEIEGMAEYMFELLNNTQLAHTMGLKGRAWVEKNYDLNHSIRELWKVIQS